MEALVVLARIYPPKTNMKELCEVLEWGSISILGRVRSALFLGCEERGFQCRDYAGAIGSLQQGIALVFKLPILLRSQRSQALQATCAPKLAAPQVLPARASTDHLCGRGQRLSLPSSHGIFKLRVWLRVRSGATQQAE